MAAQIGRGAAQAGAPLATRRTPRQRSTPRAAATVDIPQHFSKLAPKGDLILAKVAEAEVKTAGGVLLPAAAQKRPTSGDVVAVGDGRVGGRVLDFQLQPGQTVLYNKFGIGSTEVNVQGEVFILIREDDCMGTLPRTGATADDIPQLQPVGDRVLLKVQEAAGQTGAGLFLPESAKQKPTAGTVVATGPGRREKDGTRKPPGVRAGDSVLYFKWAGDQVETTAGEPYIVVHESDILCRV